MLKRHEVEILLKAGHSKAEVARLAKLVCGQWPGQRKTPCGATLEAHVHSDLVAADDGFRRDDDEGLFPSRPGPPGNHPERLIEEAEARARMSTLQRNELLTQSKILEKETLPSAKEAYQHSE